MNREDPRHVERTVGESFKPVYCQLLLKRVPPRSQVTKSNLVVPDGQGGARKAGKRSQGGSALELEVVKVGQGKDPVSEEFPKDWLKPGDRVAVGTMTGFAIYLNGEEFIIVDASQVLGIVSQEDTNPLVE